MRQILAIALAIMFVSVSASAQTAFTNADVLKLHAAGFTEDEIVAAIEAAPAKSFDTSTDALIALRNAGIGRKVMAEILGTASAPQAGAPEPAPTATAGNNNDGVGSKVANVGRKVLGWRPFGNRNSGDDEGEDAIENNATRDGMPATFLVNMSATEACNALRNHFIRQGATLEQNDCNGGQLATAWKRNSSRWNPTRKKEVRTIVGFISQGQQTEVQVSVRERTTLTDNFSGDGEIKGELTNDALPDIRAAIIR